MIAIWFITSTLQWIGMAKIMDVSVVVPLHNECETVSELIGQICKAFESDLLRNKRCELILVDDGSSDSTFNVAKQIASAETEHVIRAISLRRNFGQTAAMQVGFQASQGWIIVSLDGDMQNDPSDIPRMIRLLEADDLDLVCGRRVNRKDKLWSRRLPSWIANRLIGWATGIKVSDYGCSLKVYRAEVLHQIRLIGEMHRFIPAWFVKVTSPNRIKEMDVSHFPRVHGKTHYGISRTFRVLMDLLSVVFFTRYKNRPGHFFGMIGMVMFAFGAVMLTATLLDKYVAGNEIGGRPMLLIGTFSFFTGIHVVCLGIVAEILTRIYGQTPASAKTSILQEFSNSRPLSDSNATSRKVA
ncbi:MAG: glycosyltransferase family 2 protein [Planctomycetota bacterium]|nr:glycosyltransferase family 2 protein [Planctomycetota bacterium]